MSDSKEKNRLNPDEEAPTADGHTTSNSRELLAGFAFSLDDVLDKGFDSLEPVHVPLSKDLHLFETPPPPSLVPPPVKEEPKALPTHVEQEAGMSTLDLGPDDIIASAASTNEFEKLSTPVKPPTIKPVSPVQSKGGGHLMTTMDLGPEDILSLESEDDFPVPKQIKLSLMDTIQSPHPDLVMPDQDLVTESQEAIIVVRGPGSSSELPAYSNGVEANEVDDANDQIRVMRGRGSSGELPAVSPDATQKISPHALREALEQRNLHAKETSDETLRIKREDALSAAKERTTNAKRSDPFVETLQLPPEAILAIAEAHASREDLGEAPTAPGEYTFQEQLQVKVVEESEMVDSQQTIPPEQEVSSPSLDAPVTPAPSSTLQLPKDAISSIAQARIDNEAGDMSRAPTAPGNYSELQQIRDQLLDQATGSNHERNESPSEAESLPSQSHEGIAADAEASKELDTPYETPEESKREEASRPSIDAHVVGNQEGHVQRGRPDGLGGFVEPTLRTNSSNSLPAAPASESSEAIQPPQSNPSQPALPMHPTPPPQTSSQSMDDFLSAAPATVSKPPSVIAQILWASLMGSVILAGVWFYFFSR